MIANPVTTAELTINDYHIHAVIDNDGDLNLYVRHSTKVQLQSTDSEVDCHDNEVAFRVLNPATNTPLLDLAAASKKFPSLEFLDDSIILCQETLYLKSDSDHYIEVEFALSDQNTIEFTITDGDHKSSGAIEYTKGIPSIQEAITLCLSTLENPKHKEDPSYHKAMTRVVNRAVKVAEKNYTRIIKHLGKLIEK